MEDLCEDEASAKDWKTMKKDFLGRYDRARTDLNSVICGHPKQKKDESASDFLDRLASG